MTEYNFDDLFTFALVVLYRNFLMLRIHKLVWISNILDLYFTVF